MSYPCIVRDVENNSPLFVTLVCGDDDDISVSVEDITLSPEGRFYKPSNKAVTLFKKLRGKVLTFDKDVGKVVLVDIQDYQNFISI